MAAELKRRVIGQAPACEALAQAVLRARLGFEVDRRPIGVYLFAGPTGVGKTELAKATAEFLFGSDDQLLRLDLNEFMEKHAVARLVGSPPGYVDSDREGQLTGALRRTPHCAVLLDEMEKAHPDVLNLFLQLFDEGRLTDAMGRTADATNALFILTTNLALDAEPAMGFPTADKMQSREALLQHGLRPELVNRIDQVIVFRPLGPDDFRDICTLQLNALATQLEKQQITLGWDDSVPAYLAAAGQSALFGARELRRSIDHRVRDEIATRIARGVIRSHQAITLRIADGLLTFSGESNRG